MSVAGNVSYGRVGEEFHYHRDVVSDVGSKHHGRLKTGRISRRIVSFDEVTLALASPSIRSVGPLVDKVIAPL